MPAAFSAGINNVHKHHCNYFICQLNQFAVMLGQKYVKKAENAGNLQNFKKTTKHFPLYVGKFPINSTKRGEMWHPSLFVSYWICTAPRPQHTVVNFHCASVCILKCILRLSHGCRDGAYATMIIVSIQIHLQRHFSFMNIYCHIHATFIFATHC